MKKIKIGEFFWQSCNQEPGCLVHFVRLLAVCWPSIQSACSIWQFYTVSWYYTVPGPYIGMAWHWQKNSQTILTNSFQLINESSCQCYIRTRNHGSTYWLHAPTIPVSTVLLRWKKQDQIWKNNFKSKKLANLVGGGVPLVPHNPLPPKLRAW